MIEDGKIFCDACQQQIVLDPNPFTQMLVEFVRGSADRHYCQACLPNATAPPARFFANSSSDRAGE